MNNVMSLLTFNGIFKWSDTYIEKENQVFLAGDIKKRFNIISFLPTIISFWTFLF